MEKIDEARGEKNQEGQDRDKATGSKPGWTESLPFPSLGGDEELEDDKSKSPSEDKNNLREEIGEGALSSHEKNTEAGKNSVKDNPNEEVKEELKDHLSDIEMDSVVNGDRGDEEGFIKVDSRGRTRGSTRVREEKTNEEEVPDCGPTIGGLSGVTKEIQGLLAEIGLKHVKVTPEGNCFYLAFSKGMYGKSSKWKEVRNRGARPHREQRRILQGEAGG